MESQGKPNNLDLQPQELYLPWENFRPVTPLHIDYKPLIIYWQLNQEFTVLWIHHLRWEEWEPLRFTEAKSSRTSCRSASSRHPAFHPSMVNWIASGRSTPGGVQGLLWLPLILGLLLVRVSCAESDESQEVLGENNTASTESPVGSVFTNNDMHA